MTRTAVLGIGKMGAGMARSLRRAGHDVVAWNRTAAKAEGLRPDGIEVAGSVSDAVTGADVVITMLYDADSVIEVADELVGALAPGAVWLQAATVGPEGIARIAEAAGDGVALVDAPVLGTVKPAEDGTLVALVSGPSDAIERAGEALDAIGSKTVVAGERLGDASRLKLVCNAWVLTVTAGIAQSVELARALDLDPSLFLQAVEGGAVDTPYLHVKGKAIIDDDLTPSFEVDGGRKDLELIRTATGEAGVRTDLLDALTALFGRASEAGHGQDDLAAVARGFGPVIASPASRPARR